MNFSQFKLISYEGTDQTQTWLPPFVRTMRGFDSTSRVEHRRVQVVPCSRGWRLELHVNLTVSILIFTAQDTTPSDGVGFTSCHSSCRWCNQGNSAMGKWLEFPRGLNPISVFVRSIGGKINTDSLTWSCDIVVSLWLSGLCVCFRIGFGLHQYRSGGPGTRHFPPCSFWRIQLEGETFYCCGLVA